RRGRPGRDRERVGCRDLPRHRLVARGTDEPEPRPPARRLPDRGAPRRASRRGDAERVRGRNSGERLRRARAAGTDYFPTTRIEKLPSIIFGRWRRSPSFGCAWASNIAAPRYTACVFVSSAIVFDRSCVATFSTTRNVVGSSSWTIVKVPSPFEA